MGVERRVDTIRPRPYCAETMKTAVSTQVLIQGLVRSPDREGALAHLDPERGFAFVARGAMSFSDVIDPTIWVKEKLSLALTARGDSDEPPLRRAIAALCAEQPAREAPKTGGSRSPFVREREWMRAHPGGSKWIPHHVRLIPPRRRPGRRRLLLPRGSRRTRKKSWRKSIRSSSSRSSQPKETGASMPQCMFQR